MSAVERTSGHAALMDGVYRRQRHFYDLTRKYYLLGRDRMIAGLGVPPNGTVLELGCGTGRNIILAARASSRRPLLRPRHIERDAGDSVGRARPRRIAAQGQARTGRRHGVRRRKTVRPGKLRPCLHLLFAVDDPRLGKGRFGRIGRAETGRLAAYRRFRTAGALAPLVPGSPAGLAGEIPRRTARFDCAKCWNRSVSRKPQTFLSKRFIEVMRYTRSCGSRPDLLFHRLRERLDQLLRLVAEFRWGQPEPHHHQFL